MTTAINAHATMTQKTFADQPKSLKMNGVESHKTLNHWLFNGLNPELKSTFFELTRQVKYGPREEVFHEGEPAFGFYLICSGKVKLSKRTSAGKKMILRVFSAGDVLGAETMFGGEVYDCHAETMETTTLRFIERRAFMNIIRESPEVAISFIETLSQEMRMFESKLVETAYEGSNERVANLLLRLSEKYGFENAEGIDVGLELKRGELAQMAGLTTETTIRTLRKFEQRGWIQLHRNRVVLVDIAAIEGLAEMYLEPVASPDMMTA